MTQVRNRGSRGWLLLAFAAAICILFVSAFTPMFEAGYRPFMSFQTTQGVMKEAGTIPCGRRGYASVAPRVRYEYTVNRDVHSGGQYGLGTLCASRANVEDAMKSYVPDTPVTVYYSVSHPSFAVLTPEWSPNSILGIVFGIVFIGGALTAWHIGRRSKT